MSDRPWFGVYIKGAVEPMAVFMPAREDRARDWMRMLNRKNPQAPLEIRETYVHFGEEARGEDNPYLLHGGELQRAEDARQNT